MSDELSADVKLQLDDLLTWGGGGNDMVRLIAGLDARGRAALAYIREREAEAGRRAHEMHEALRAAGLDPDSVSAAPGEDAKKGGKK